MLLPQQTCSIASPVVPHAPIKPCWLRLLAETTGHPVSGYSRRGSFFKGILDVLQAGSLLL